MKVTVTDSRQGESLLKSAGKPLNQENEKTFVF